MRTRIDALGIRRVLIPSDPGALSALGILDADLRREFSRTVMLAPRSRKSQASFANSNPKPAPHSPLKERRSILARSADLRYHGQGFELRVDWSANAVARFHRLHAQSYGYADPSRAIEIVTLRVQAIASVRSNRVLSAQNPPARRAQRANPRTSHI